MRDAGFPLYATRKQRRHFRRARATLAAARCVRLGLTYSGRAFRAKANVGERVGFFHSSVLP